LKVGSHGIGEAEDEGGEDGADGGSAGHHLGRVGHVASARGDTRGEVGGIAHAEEAARDAGQDAGYDKRKELHLDGVDARRLGRFDILSGGFDPPADGGLVEDEVDRHHGEGGQPDDEVLARNHLTDPGDGFHEWYFYERNYL